MSPIDDKDRRYMMTDDERATIGQKQRSKRESVPPTPPKPGSLEALLARIPATWKALTLIGAIFVAGVMGHAYLIDYTKKYATHEDLAQHSLKEADLREQVRALRENNAARSADIMAIQTDTAAVREDIRTLLQYMLSNPPTRDTTPPRKRKP